MRSLLELVYYALVFVILASVLVTWFPQARYSPFGQLMTRLAEPILAPFRAIFKPVRVSPRGDMIDYSPLICLVVIGLIFRISLRFIP